MELPQIMTEEHKLRSVWPLKSKRMHHKSESMAGWAITGPGQSCGGFSCVCIWVPASPSLSFPIGGGFHRVIHEHGKTIIQKQSQDVRGLKLELCLLYWNTGRKSKWVLGIFHGCSLFLQDCVPGESLLLSVPVTIEQLCPAAVPVQDFGESFSAPDACSFPHVKTKSFNKQCLRCIPEVFRQMYTLGKHFRTVCIFSAVHIMSTAVRSPTFQPVLPWCMATHFLSWPQRTGCGLGSPLLSVTRRLSVNCDPHSYQPLEDGAWTKDPLQQPPHGLSLLSQRYSHFKKTLSMGL